MSEDSNNPPKGPSVAGITAVVAAATLPLLKVGSAEATMQCDFHDKYNVVMDLQDPADCSDCNQIFDPRGCTPEDMADALGDKGDLSDFVGDFGDIGSDFGDFGGGGS